MMDVDFDEAPPAPDTSVIHAAVFGGPSVNPEELLIGACLIDPKTVIQKTASRLSVVHFDIPQNQEIWLAILATHTDANPTSFDRVVLHLQEKRRLNEAGGIQHLIAISNSIVPTVHLGLQVERHIQTLVERRSRQMLRAAAEDIIALSDGADFEEVLEQSKRIIAQALPKGTTANPARGAFEFQIPPKDDPSILIGRRFLSKGDGFIISSTSGMGKSALSLQFAISWALQRPLFGGFKPARPLKSLIFQAEDAEGDVAEAVNGIAEGMKLTRQERKLVDERVKIVTDRVNRGDAFIREIRSHTDSGDWDIVWLNPLLAFLDGDITEATDAGRFLRGGLNALNHPTPKFAIGVIHHTVKPPKEKADRKWNEMMYEMAGSAELTNWARAIMFLQAHPDREGEFVFHLAKRGKRAEVIRPTPQGAGFREEIVTKIGLRHSTGTFRPHESADEIPIIHWEPCEVTIQAPKKAAGRPARYSIEDFIQHFPHGPEKARPSNMIHRDVSKASGISVNAFKDLCARAAKEGLIMVVEKAGVGPSYYVDL